MALKCSFSTPVATQRPCTSGRCLAVPQPQTCRHHFAAAPAQLRRRRSSAVSASRSPVVVRAAAAAVEAPSEQKIRIKLRSYWANLLADAVEQIKVAAESSGARFSGPVYLPTRKKVYCVLTSPHVNKDAREHFEIRIHSRLVDVKDLTSVTIDKLMTLELPSGVDVEIKL